MTDIQKELIVDALALYCQTLIKDECYKSAQECCELINLINNKAFG